jgi:hypothetical protein
MPARSGHAALALHAAADSACDSSAAELVEQKAGKTLSGGSTEVLPELFEFVCLGAWNRSGSILFELFLASTHRKYVAKACGSSIAGNFSRSACVAALMEASGFLI